MTVLLVDNVDSDASVLASALRVEGVEVVVANTASAARAAVASDEVTLAIVDLMLRSEAGCNGLELARELRKAHPFMRVILTSSYHLSERQLARADCGVTGFIPKPYDMREVVTFVRQKASAPPSCPRVWAQESPSSVKYTRSLEALVEREDPPSSTRRSTTPLPLPAEDPLAEGRR